MFTSNEYIIPSNFCRYSGDKIKFKIVPIIPGKNWITEVRLPFYLKAKDFFDDYLKQNSSALVLFDGCTPEIKTLLDDYGFHSLLVGQEAILDLNVNHFKKKSLKALIKRGYRHGSVKELSFSSGNLKLLEAFKQHTSIAKLPKLNHLFCTTFEEFTRMFVFIDKKGEWLGLITISHKTQNIMQTELILRRAKNPVGVMEVLIFEIFNTLKKEGKEFWSLGAVPFVVKVPFSFSKQWLINFIGRRLRFAYNYKGLFAFKNKFMPAWIDYYICSGNNLSFLQLSDMMRKTKLLSLVMKKIYSKFWIKNE
ncbi:MAG: phosphatidylglycerol lysyltransferase domain-containing protein [Ignavibacteriaceae bacterium]